jgi:hypothetical protein
VTGELKKSSHLERLGVRAALLGVALLAAGGVYDIRTFRTSPKEPDLTHSVMQVSHGDQRFKTPEQIRTFWHLNTAGVITFTIGVAMVVVSDRLKKRAAAG